MGIYCELAGDLTNALKYYEYGYKYITKSITDEKDILRLLELKMCAFLFIFKS